MTTTKVNSEFIAVNAISGTIIADGAITSTHLAVNSVDSSELVTGSIDTIHIAANQVTATKIVTNGVLTRHISDDQVTADKLANSINTDIATGPAALPKAGGTMTGNLTVNAIVDADNFKINNAQGTDGQVLTSTGSGVAWEDAAGGVAGIVSSADATAITIDSSERVGIGTTAPAVPLHVVGDIRIDGGNQMTNEIAWFNSSHYLAGIRQASHGSYNDSGGLQFLTSGTSNAAESVKMVIDTQGNVGIGTTAPAVSLDVGTSTNGIRLPNGTTAQRPTGANGMIRYNSTIEGVEEYRGGAWHNLSGTFSGSGGTTYTSGVYTIHKFTSSGGITFNSAGQVDVLVVAGGGGGGTNANIRGSGGGAGGLIYITGYPVTGSSYTVGIGAGGAEDASGTNSTFAGNSTTLTAIGGGKGGDDDGSDDGQPGGSGGGNWYPGYPGAPGTQPTNTNNGSTTYPSTGFGYPGGTSGSVHPYGSGGGGAGGAGKDFNDSSNKAEGGPGKDMSATFGTSVGESGWFAGGGGSGAYPPNAGTDVRFDGGQGGGGRGWNGGTESAQNGTANTGGGGGAGGSGGSGIVLVRYAT
jgi:hypothetical protein